MSFLFWIVYFPKLIDFSHWKFSSCLNRPSGPRPSFLEWRCPVKSWQQFHFHQSQQKSPWQKNVSSPVGKVSPAVSPWFLVSSRVQTRQMDLPKMATRNDLFLATLKAKMSSLRGREPKRHGFDDWCSILTFAQCTTKKFRHEEHPYRSVFLFAWYSMVKLSPCKPGIQELSNIELGDVKQEELSGCSEQSNGGVPELYVSGLKKDPNVNFNNILHLSSLCSARAAPKIQRHFGRIWDDEYVQCQRGKKNAFFWSFWEFDFIEQVMNLGSQCNIPCFTIIPSYFLCANCLQKITMAPSKGVVWQQLFKSWQLGTLKSTTSWSICAHTTRRHLSNYLAICSKKCAIVSATLQVRGWKFGPKMKCRGWKSK